ncbi:MAG: hypothetical protein IKG67_11915 [Parasporobacterium sp.]|nr:hypothetical protein [Parasporobacterium sp.]
MTITNLRNLTFRLQQLDLEIEDCRQQLALAPEGAVFSRRISEDTYRYFKRVRFSDGSEKELYLGKKARSEAVALARKMFTEKHLQDLLQEKKLLRSILTYQNTEPAADTFLKSHPGIGKLLAENQENKLSAESLCWKTMPYDRNPNHPEQLKYPTIMPGLLVRSKAEADIVSRLEYFGVPYHYDEVMNFNGIKIAMDFLCLNITTGNIWYWDHRGMLDRPDYIRKTLYCENIFLNAGIIPGINMIVTTETLDHPLDLQWVDQLIQHFLL